MKEAYVGGFKCVSCLLGPFQCFQLTRAFVATHMCDCWIIWRLMVLGFEQLRAGAMAFRAGGKGEGSDVGCAGL